MNRRTGAFALADATDVISPRLTGNLHACRRLVWTDAVPVLGPLPHGADHRPGAYRLTGHGPATGLGPWGRISLKLDTVPWLVIAGCLSGRGSQLPLLHEGQAAPSAAARLQELGGIYGLAGPAGVAR